jgi:hypothetical protein
MRMRGNVYWAWVDPALNHRSYEETLPDGSRIDVQVRLSRGGTTQLFLGVYARAGMALHEEAYDDWPKRSLVRALAWGSMRARQIAETEVSAVPLKAALQ